MSQSSALKAFVLVCFLAASLSVPVSGHRSLAQAQAPQGPTTDNELLNFALNIEYLKAEFYSCAATGQPLPADLRGGGPASDGCQQASLTDAQALARNLATNEVNHVRFLRGLLGGDAVPIPKIDIGTAFATAANIAFNETVDPPFSPYTDDVSFFQGAFLFEDVGVTAYEGLVPGLQSAENLLAATQLIGAESYHAGLVRTILYQDRDQASGPNNDTVGEAVLDFGFLRGRVGSGNGQGVTTNTPSGEEANVVPVNPDGLAFVRNPSQVVLIVTLGGGSAGGGFFPTGLTGTVGVTKT